MKKETIIIYTDGSCRGNGRKNAVGGIGIHFPNHELEDLSRIFTQGYCTNQRTELYAILTAIRYVRKRLGLKNYKIKIKTDSTYCINCITKWIYGWINNGWKTKTGENVANKELIELIYRYYKKYDIKFEHVEAHTGGTDSDSLANSIADDLAQRATKRAQKTRRSNKKYSNTESERKVQRSDKSYDSTESESPKKSKSKNHKFSKPDPNNFIIELVKSDD